MTTVAIRTEEREPQVSKVRQNFQSDGAVLRVHRWEPKSTDEAGDIERPRNNAEGKPVCWSDCESIPGHRGGPRGRENVLGHARNPETPYSLGSSETSGSLGGPFELVRSEVLDAPFRPGGLPEFPDCVWAPEFKIHEVTLGAAIPTGTLSRQRSSISHLRRASVSSRDEFVADSSMSWAVNQYEIEVRDASKRPETFRLIGWVRLQKGSRERGAA